MDLLKAQAQRILQQLSGLSASQRMLAAALVVIMVMTLLYWGRYASESAYVPLLDQSFSQDELATILPRLQSMGAKPEGDRIVIPSDNRFAALAILSQDELLPRDTSVGFEKLAQSLISPWDSQKLTDAKLGNIGDRVLSNVIRAMPNVKTAQVISDRAPQRQIGRENRATASVFVTTRDGKASKKMARSIAQFVAGAHAGMQLRDVNVQIDDRSHAFTNEGDDTQLASGELLDEIRNHEKYNQEKVLSFFSHLPNTRVQVTVDLDTKSIQETATLYDNANTVVKEQQNRTNTEEITSGSPAPMEPGVIPNAGVSLAAPPAISGSTSTKTEEETKNAIFPGMRQLSTKTPAGKPTVVGVAIHVPLSDFARIWKSHNPDTKDPGVEVLGPLVDAQLTKAKAAVITALGLKEPEIVNVSWYEDMMIPMDNPGVVQASAGPNIVGMMSGYTREIALGALAMISLFMMTSMVRKGTTIPSVPIIEEMPEPQELVAREPIAGEATMGGQMLDGMELDEDAVRTQQMLDQVQTMVREDPDAAANLVKRWLNRA